MTEPTTTDRPRQLTMAGWFVVVGSVFLVASVFDSVANLNSVDTRQSVTDALTTGSGAGLGLSVSTALTLMRVGLTVAAVCAAAAAVAGFFVLRRHRGARVLLAVLAVPLLVTAPLTGGLMGALVVAATMTMWNGQARDWFAGRPVRQAQPLGGRGPQDGGTPAPRKANPFDQHGDLGAGPEHMPGQQPGQLPGQEPGRDPQSPPASDAPSGSTTPPSVAFPSRQPAATPGFGAPRPDDRSVLTAPRGPQSGSHPWAPGDQAAGPVPPGVKIACYATWVFSGIALVMSVVAMVVLATNPDVFVTPLVDDPSFERFAVPRESIVPSLWLLTVLGAGWCLGSCVLAGFTWRRHDWARWLLAFSAGFAFLLALAAFPVGMIHQLACALTIGGLFNATTRAWFERSRR